MRSWKTAGILLLACASIVRAQSAARVVQSFDANWRFSLSDDKSAATNAFADTSWRTLDVPHDWSIEGKIDEKNTTGAAGAFLPAGVGWYRKHFNTDANWAGKKIYVEFDGVMANSDVYINGQNLGHRPFGYIGFRYDMTDKLAPAGQENVLAVRCDNSQQPASRWYAGAGIYRHTRLIVTDPVHVDESATFITTPRVGKSDSNVNVKTSIANDSSSPGNVSLHVRLMDPDGKQIAETDSQPTKIESGKTADFSVDFKDIPARLWDVDQPNVYRAIVQVKSGDRVVDDESTPFGVRLAEFNADTGFWLNGKNLKLKGVCLHQDLGGLGVAVPIAAWERRLTLLKQIGCNAIRTAHNPMAPEFYDLCDRMGFMVMDEAFDCWTVGKNPFDYHLYFPNWSKTDLADAITQHRNHPCIVIYSAGNEIKDTPNVELAKQILGGMIAMYHQLDPTRPVTQALFRPNVSHDYDNGLADMLDVVGQNYRDAELLAAHKQKPTRKIVGTENGKELKIWQAARDNPFHSGQFLWVGFDYLGEGKHWPDIGNYQGMFETTGYPRPIAQQRQSWWSDTPMVCIARDAGQVPTGNQQGEPQFRPISMSDWTPEKPNPKGEAVQVYSNCESVELFLNDKSLGKQPQTKDGSPRKWTVPFETGTIKAVASNGGKEVATHELKTAGKVARINLSAHKTTIKPVFDDVAYITANTADEAGVPQPLGTNRVTFKVTGPAKIVMVDNGDHRDHDPFIADNRKAFHGQCVAVVRATGVGDISVLASSEGLQSGVVQLKAEQ